MVRYANLAQTASVTTKIIFDAVSQWHPARSQQQSTPSEIKATSTEDQSDHHSQWDTSELGRPDDEPRAFPWGRQAFLKHAASRILQRVSDNVARLWELRVLCSFRLRDVVEPQSETQARARRDYAFWFSPTTGAVPQEP
jgi:hypothetical protein